MMVLRMLCDSSLSCKFPGTHSCPQVQLHHSTTLPLCGRNHSIKVESLARNFSIWESDKNSMHGVHLEKEVCCFSGKKLVMSDNCLVRFGLGSEQLSLTSMCSFSFGRRRTSESIGIITACLRRDPEAQLLPVQLRKLIQPLLNSIIESVSKASLNHTEIHNGQQRSRSLCNHWPVLPMATLLRDIKREMKCYFSIWHEAAVSRYRASTINNIHSFMNLACFFVLLVIVTMPYHSNMTLGCNCPKEWFFDMCSQWAAAQQGRQALQKALSFWLTGPG